MSTLLILCALAACCIPGAVARAKKPSLEVVVFGDSVSDNGNMFRAYKLPNSTLYYQGRSSNGPIWVDYMARLTTGKVYNYAVVAGVACRNNTQPQVRAAFPKLNLGLDDQVDAYLGDVARGRIKAPKGRRVAFIWIGHNDWLVKFAEGDASPVSALATIRGMMACYASGITKLLASRTFNIVYLMNLAPLEVLPIAALSSPPPVLAQITLLVDTMNMTMAGLVGGFRTARVRSFDVTSVLRYAIQDPPPGITNTRLPCMVLDTIFSHTPNVTSRCSRPNNYVFYDTEHPTSVVHEKAIIPRIVERLKRDRMM